MNQITITSAEIAFAAAGLLITISLLLLKPAWNSLSEMVSSLPEGQRKAIRNLRAISDEREKDKSALIMVHFVGCMCLVATIFLAVTAMGGVISVMLGYRMGFYQQENYDFGRACLFAGSFFFAVGFYALGLSYMDKVVSLATGKPELLTIELKTLPPRTDSRISERRVFERLFGFFLIGFLILIFALEVLNPFGTWMKILVALAIMALFLLIVMTMRRIRSKRSKG